MFVPNDPLKGQELAEQLLDLQFGLGLEGRRLTLLSLGEAYRACRGHILRPNRKRHSDAPRLSLAIRARLHAAILVGRTRQLWFDFSC